LRIVKENFFGFVCITIFPEKAQNKIKQSRDRDDFLLMMPIHKAKSPCISSLLEKYKTSKQTLFEQLSSRRKINNDPSAANQSMCQHWVP